MVNPEHLIGKVIDGHYRLTRYIGSGTFGHVFEASETFIDGDVSRVALKLIYPASAVELTAVRREVEGLARLTHDHVIAYRTCGPRDDSLSAFVYIVTELAETSLSQPIQSRRPLAGGELLAMARGIASALAHIHGRGSVHRDVKPENIFRAEGRWKLGDFGFARPIEGSLVQGSCLAGTLAYMPPEALRGEIGAPTDVYAFGVTLWECLTGHRACEGSAWLEFSSAIRDPASNLVAGLGEPWSTLIPDCLRVDPRERCSADVILEGLDAPAGASPRGARQSSRSTERSQQPSLLETEGPVATDNHPPNGPAPVFHERAERPRPRSWFLTGVGPALLPLTAVLCLSLGFRLHGKQSAPQTTRPPIPPAKPGAMPGKTSSESPRARLAMAEDSWRAGDYSEAERRAEAVVRTDRSNVAALKLLGAAALVRHAAGEGAQRYRSALRADAKDGEAWLGYATCLERQRQLRQACFAYRQALQFAGSNDGIQSEAEAGVRRTRRSKG